MSTKLDTTPRLHGRAECAPVHERTYMRILRRWLIWLSLLPIAAFAQAAPERQHLIIEELTCRGNEVTSCDFILGHLYLAPGDVVDEEEIGNARLRLASLPSFHSVDIYLEKGAARGLVRVVIEVREADPYTREWFGGTSYRIDDLSQLLAGRLTHQNLFGAGKLLDVLVVAIAPIQGHIREEYAARVQFVDPHWLGSKRTFFIAGLNGGVSEFGLPDGQQRQRLENVGVDLAVGRRIFDFSYLSLSSRYNPLIHIQQDLLSPDGGVERHQFSFHNHTFSLNYGWNSEDDPYFPTRGSRASLNWIWASTADDMITEGGFRKTWTDGRNTSWSVQIADSPGSEYRQRIDEHFAWMAGFARPIVGSQGGEIQRGRWYIEAGYSPQGRTERGERLREFGLKVGVRLETRSFGMVDLYAIGSGLLTEGNLP
ncbi:MAG: BamA/TamA family outer membrane protein [Steroidobacter sp.]